MKRFTGTPGFLGIVLFAAFTAAVLVPLPALATSTATSSLMVSASVANACSVNAGSLSFGNYTGSDLTANAPITYTCTSGQTPTISLSVGGHSANKVNTTRALSDGQTTAHYMDYEIYQDVANQAVWGDISTSWVVSPTTTGVAQVVTAYGKIPGGQTSAPVGTYTDTVTVTITY